MNFIEDLKYRGLIYDMTDEALLDALENQKLTFYLGADPTADSLHVGHLVAYLTAKRLIDHGHKAILLIGGATGLIGDPRGSSERELLSVEKSLSNAKAISEQVKKMFDFDLVNNYDWISKINVVDFLRDYGKCFNVNYMLNKETVQKRLESGISYTEFSYQILQALDFEYLYKTKGVTLQIGGQDQWGNITSGIELIRKHHGFEAKAYGFTFPLVTKADGTKFGKSEGGTLWLDANKTTPYEFYQYWINTADQDVLRFLKQFTFLSKEEIENVMAEFEKAPHERLAQKVLAEKITTLVHGKEAYESVLRISSALFSGNIEQLSAEEIDMGFKNAPSITAVEDMNILDALVSSQLASSKREAREFVGSGAVSVNGQKVTSIDFIITKENALYNKLSVIKRGKKKYSLVRH